jgi:hypothetical protein
MEPMNASPSNLTVHSPLYRIARRGVICGGLALILANLLPAQSSSRTKKITGPRALGLLEITPSGKVSLLPVVIMIDGEFYDASAYKAAPVPLALYTDTVYEGVKTGVSQGLFTVTMAQHGQDTWRGQGKWQSAADIAGAAAKKKASAAAAEKAKAIRDNADGPPVLRRAGAAPPAPAPTPVTTSDADPDDPNAPPVLKRPASDQTPSATTATPAASTPTPATSTPTLPAPATVTQAGTPVASVPAPAPQTPPPAANDPNVPTLRRGKEAAMKEEAREAAMPSDEPATKALANGKVPTITMTATATSNGVQLIPAISDAAGPDPRPYAYSMKPEEESKFRSKVLALAAIEIRARAKDLGLTTATTVPAHTAAHTAAASHSSKAAKPPEPNFDDVQMRVFDLSNNNEPVLVLTAKARLPKSAKGPDTDMQYVVTLVAREDIYGDLHKVFSNVTDTQHLDVSPRMDFIDAVDADGDGRGELLFQQVSDSGKAFVVYRVIGDQLWALFQGKIG